MYPLLDDFQMKHAFESYKDNPYFEKVSTLEEFKEEYLKRTIVSRPNLIDLHTKSLANFLANQDLCSNSLKILADLMADKEAANKIKFINDGSYFNHRIWITSSFGDSKLEFFIDINPIISNLFESNNSNEALDFIKKNFDTILIQSPLALTREQLIKYLEYGKEQLQDFE